MGILDKIEIPRRVCPVIFMLDTSMSMEGELIGAVNSAMEELLPELITMNRENTDSEIQIAIMSFGFEVQWVTGNSGLVTPKYVWCDLEADGDTSLGKAFQELNRILSVEDGFMGNTTGSVAPVLFLFSDGKPTDDYIPALAELKKNEWYKVAAKVAIGYGESNDDILREFTENSDTVLHTQNPRELKKMIRFVALTSSKVASSDMAVSSSTHISENDFDDTTNEVATALKNDDFEINFDDPYEAW